MVQVAPRRSCDCEHAWQRDCYERYDAKRKHVRQLRDVGEGVEQGSYRERYETQPHDHATRPHERVVDVTLVAHVIRGTRRGGYHGKVTCGACP